MHLSHIILSRYNIIIIIKKKTHALYYLCMHDIIKTSPPKQNHAYMFSASLDVEREGNLKPFFNFPI